MSQPIPSFENKLAEHRIEITRKPLEILQINVGKLCNQACHHCHVEAGPKRTEIMEKKTVDRLIKLLDQSSAIHTVDITGGAPELNPHFHTLVAAARQRGKEVIDRCNLTVFFEKGQEETAHFLKAHQVKIVASLPCYSKDNVDRQRGNGVFDKSIRALRLLNELGYGKTNSEQSEREGEAPTAPRSGPSLWGCQPFRAPFAEQTASGAPEVLIQATRAPMINLELDLVYNPLGAFLPPSQEKLELDYKKKLRELFGIEFNHLFTITNMPIKRFLDQLVRENKYEEYMTLLVNNFNMSAAENVMCRNLVSVGWDGKIYDCDFNQMLEIPVGGKHRTIWEIESFDQINESPIAFAGHCYGCTAGAGSSCGGSIV